ncbi:MAG: 4-hydroxybenzoate octaprenyltransferase [Pseudomonadota bacterium]
MDTNTEGQVADAAQGNWVDLYAPAWTRPYLRLSRADRLKPVWLLFLPCAWGVLLAALATGPKMWDLWIIGGCAIGSILMRGAGCTWNDIQDRHYDAQVARTKSRPLPAGQVSVTGAVIWMCLQALVSLAILLSYSNATIMVGLASLVFVAIYPFAKRFTWWPQVFLGLAFNWGALLAWTAHSGSLGWPAIVLYVAGIFWTLFYDTIYAHQDTEDDALIGVKSTARLFGDDTPKWLFRFLVATVLLMTVAIVLAMGDASILALVIALGGPWALGWHLTWQLRRLDTSDADLCMRLFRSNRDAGLLPVLFFAAALLA